MTYSLELMARDSKRCIRGYRLRRHIARNAKLNKSTASKAKAVSVIAATSIIPLVAQAFA